MENSTSHQQKAPINMDVQEGNIQHDPSDPHGLKTKVQQHDRQQEKDSGSDRQPVNKLPGKERGKAEQVTAKDPKKADADPEQPTDQPAE